MPALRGSAGWLRGLHRDERGAVSLETVLIVGAIVLPVLIFLIKYGWPRVVVFFDKGMSDLDKAIDREFPGR